MPNSVKYLEDRFIAFNGEGKIQTNAETPLADADIDTRHKCRITLEDVIEREDERDCEDVDLTGQPIRTRLRRLRLQYPSTTPQLIAFWFAYHVGSATAPTGTPANEVQTLTRTGTVSGGTFTISYTLEGRTVTTAPIAYDATAAEIQAALTTTKMKWIQPGDVVVSGDWGTAITLTFGGRLGNADLPLPTINNTAITGGGTVDAAQTTPGAQRYHTFARSVERTKVRFSFGLGWLTGSANPEKFGGFVVESFNPPIPRRQKVTMEISIVGPFEPEEMAGYTIPDCVNPDPLLAEDCKIVVNSNWETTDINNVNPTLNDNIPLDIESAFGFDGLDPETLARGRQPSYEIPASIFGAEGDAIYTLAENERTQDPVDVKIHYGMPGNRFTLLAPQTKVKFQQERLTFVGAANRSAINLQLTPFKDDQDPPISGEAYISQANAFLLDT